jgi:hypothetical protein
VVLQNQWFALQMMLRANGYEEFLPTCSVRKNAFLTKHRFFQRTYSAVNANVYGLIVTTPRVIRIVEFGGKPAPIDPEEIHSIQVLTNSVSPLCGWKGLNVGDKVRVEEGCRRSTYFCSAQAAPAGFDQYDDEDGLSLRLIQSGLRPSAPERSVYHRLLSRRLSCVADLFEHRF